MKKTTCALTTALFIFTGCGGGGDNADTGYTPVTSIVEVNPPQTSSNISLKITTIEEQQTTDASTIIKWELTEEATGEIEYGFDESYGEISIKEESFNYKKHIQRLSNLEPNSIYHYRIISEDPEGNRVVSENRIFKTKSDGTVSPEPVPEEETSTPTPEFVEDTTTPVPDGATIIKGLKSGATVAAAKNNSNVLNTALLGGGKNLVIPSGEWYTYNRITVNQNTILSFKGKLHQLKQSDIYAKGHRVLMNINGGNVILNNPQLSQKGIVSFRAGTHACLTIYGGYNTGNITINGGIIEWGASNNFQGGRNNTVFNGTIFRDSVEHLVYANGIFGDGNKNDVADGLIFNDCIFERPGNGLYKDVEANHIQLRNYKNVELNNCVVSGSPKSKPGQYGLLATNIENLTVNNSFFSGYKAGLLYTGIDRNYNKPMKNVVFNNVVASSTKIAAIRKSNSTSVTTFNDCTFSNPYGIYSETKFNNCTFKPTRYHMKSVKGAKLAFDNCTWDYSKSTYSKAFVKEAGSTVTFTGTQTKIAPLDGRTFYWGPLSTER